MIAWLCAALAVAGLALECVNLRRLAVLRCSDGEPGSVVACVAMRDEQRNVRGCVRGLLAQPEIAAVVIADDGSRDATFAMLSELARNEPRLRLLRVAGSSRRSPKAAALGWAAIAARSIGATYLFFTDADVRLETGALGGALAALHARRAAALSAWPRVAASSVWDALFAPLVLLLLLQARPPRAAAGNGQFFLVRREAYERCGGHAELDSVVEDVALARALGRNGWAVVLASATAVARCSGYGSWSANVRGYGRSLYAGAGIAGCVAFAVWQCCAFGAPWLLVARAPVPSLVAIGAALLARGIVARLSGESAWAVLLAPLQGWNAAVAALLVAGLGFCGRLRWRGRPLPARR